MLDVNALTAPRLPEEDVTIVGLGVVRVRGLNRIEAMHVQAVTDPPGQDRRVVALGMVNPAMTEDEVRAWQKASPAGEIEEVTDVIRRLSGLGGQADKAAYKSVRDGSDA